MRCVAKATAQAVQRKNVRRGGQGPRGRVPLLYIMTMREKIEASETDAEPVNMRLEFQTLHSRYYSTGAQTGGGDVRGDGARGADALAVRESYQRKARARVVAQSRAYFVLSF